MSSPLKGRVSGNVAPGPASPDAGAVRRARARQLEATRSPGKVKRSAALQELQEATDRAIEVISKGYVAESQIGVGLGRPVLSVPMQPVGAAGTAVTCGPFGWERTTVSAAFETLFRNEGMRQNPAWAPALAVRCSDATTAGEVQFVDLTTGVAVALVEVLSSTSLYTIAAGTTVDTLLAPQAPGLLLPQAYGDTARLGIQARRTAGAGTITVAVRQSIGG